MTQEVVRKLAGHIKGMEPPQDEENFDTLVGLIQASLGAGTSEGAGPSRGRKHFLPQEQSQKT